MLSHHDRQLIHDAICSSEHDYFVWSRLMGEPFLINGVLSYFDGTTAAVSGLLPHKEAATKNPLTQLQCTVAHWMNKPTVEFINYFGPAIPLTDQNPNFNLLYSGAPLDFNVDLFISLGCPPTKKTERKLRHDENRVRRAGVSVEALKQEYLKSDQLDLISQLIRRPDVDASDAAYLINACSLISHPSVTIFEARKADEAAGVGITHHYFQGTPFLILAAFAPGISSIADAIYSAAINYYREQGAHFLGLGYAASVGQYRYKRKWGAVAHTPPSWQLIWQRRGSAASFLDCLYWPWQSLATKWALKSTGRVE